MFYAVAVFFFLSGVSYGASYQAYRTLGEEQIKDGTYGDALKSLMLAHRINPNDVKTIDLIGIVSMKTGKYKEALKHFKKTVMLDPAYFIGFYHMGSLYEEMGGVREKAIQMYKKALSLERNFDLAHESLGDMYFEEGKFKKAAVHYEILLKMYPDDVEYTNRLGKSLVNMNSFKKAILVLKKLLDKKTSPGILSLIGYSYRKQGNTPKAREYLKKAIELKPDFAEAICSLGKVESMDGNIFKAANYYKNAIIAEPDFAEAYYMLGKAYSVMFKIEGDRKYLRQSIDILEQATAIEKDNPEIYYQNGLNYIKEENYPRALEMFKESYFLQEENISYILGLARVYLLTDNLSSAERLLEKAEQKSIYTKKERYSKARKYFLKALRINPHSRKARNGIKEIENNRER